MDKDWEHPMRYPLDRDLLGDSTFLPLNNWSFRPKANKRQINNGRIDLSPGETTSGD